MTINIMYVSILNRSYELPSYYLIDILLISKTTFYSVILLISIVELMTGNDYVKEIKLRLEKVYKVDIYSE